MTVTSAPISSAVGAASAIDHQPSHARSSDQTSQSHEHSFSQMLNERMRGEKDQAARAAFNQSEASGKDQALKAGGQANSNLSNTGSPAAKQLTTQPVTGKPGLADGQSADNQLANGVADQDGAASTNPVPNDALSLLDQVLAGRNLNTNSGSILMTRLMQSSVGIVNLPGQSQLKAAAEKKQSPAGSAGASLSSPLLVANPAPIAAPVSDASSKGDAAAISGMKSTMDSAAIDADAPEATPIAGAGHLAFAMRLNAGLDSPASEPSPPPAPENAATPNPAIAVNPLTSTNPVNSAAIAVNMTALSADTEKKEHSNSHTKDGGSGIALTDLPASANSNPDSSVAPNQAPAPAHVPVDDRLQEYSSEPVQNVQMQVIGDDNRRVDIRLMDRAGELRVSVKSGDSTLNQTLQNKMPELTSRLEAARYRTEVWMPASTQQDQSSGGSNADGQQGQQQRPDWVEDLEGATPQNTERTY